MAKLLGGANGATHFIEDIGAVLDADAHLLLTDPYYARPSLRQYETLSDILKRLDSALDVMRALRFDEGENLETRKPDFEIANLISGSVQSVLWEDIKKSYSQSEWGDAYSNFVRAVPNNYPAPVIDALEVLRRATEHAAKRVKPKQGNNGDQKRSESVRRAFLAKNFASKYRARFGHFVPLSRDNPEHRVFALYLFAAGLDTITTRNGRRASEDGNFSLLKKFVKLDMAIFDGDPETLKRLTRKRPTKYKKKLGA